VTVEANPAAGLSLHQIARDDPARPAIVGTHGHVTTYGDLASRVNQITNALHRMGLGPGSCVLAILGNRAAYVELALATGQAGMYFTPINKHSSGAEIRLFLTDTQGKPMTRLRHPPRA
jgi:long-chain acyl-CoA synthetase